MTKLEKLHETYNFFDTLSVDQFIGMTLEDLNVNNFPALINNRISQEEAINILDNFSYYYVDMTMEELKSSHSRLIRILEDEIGELEIELGN